jgi:hypothetical protein
VKPTACITDTFGSVRVRGHRRSKRNYGQEYHCIAKARRLLHLLIAKRDRDCFSASIACVF